MARWHDGLKRVCFTGTALPNQQNQQMIHPKVWRMNPKVCRVGLKAERPHERRSVSHWPAGILSFPAASMRFVWCRVYLPGRQLPPSESKRQTAATFRSAPAEQRVKGTSLVTLHNITPVTVSHGNIQSGASSRFNPPHHLCPRFVNAEPCGHVAYRIKTPFILYCSCSYQHVCISRACMHPVPPKM